MACTLSTGASVPALGFGTAADSNRPEEVKEAVRAAAEAGYGHFDTARLYGSEGAVGEALNDAFEAQITAREEVFVTTKLWCSDLYPDGVVPALRKSLSTLGLQYVDLYLIHWPLRLKEGIFKIMEVKEDDFLPLDIKGTWQSMEKCVDLGLAKAIGVSNFSSKKIENLLAYARIPPAVSQVEMHPLWQQKRLRDYCNKVNIHVSAYSPLGGFRSSWGSPTVLEHPVIKEIASKHEKTPAQVALRWGVEQGVSVLPKSYNQARMVKNMQIFDWQLTQDDLERISKLEQKKIVVPQCVCNNTTSPYKTVEEFWDGEI